ncbi:MAG: DUF2269 domain-containing protein [Pseudomonadales bacterium]
MMGAHGLWKLVHLLSASVLFGTGIGIAFFAWFGYRRAMAIGEIDGLRAVLRLTVVADTLFTAPAVVVQLMSGIMLINLNHWSLLSPWSLTVFGLYAAVGALWIPVVVVQILMSREANRAGSIAELRPGFHRRFLAWFALGVPAFLIVVGLFYLMVAKPLTVIA